jgi:AmiR/NasT family two-component response regulator
LLTATDAPLPHALCTGMARSSCHSLVQDAQEQQPDAVLIWAADAGELAPLLDALAALPSPLPVVAVAPGAPPALQRRGFELGVQVWRPGLADADDLGDALRWAVWQFQRQTDLQQRLDDRQWTERAKGLLMMAGTVDEDSAYRLLREAAMHARLRLGELSRSVVEAAHLAEGVNLAGQQRMLSQRIVKLIAQRAAAIEPRRAKVLQDESSARIQANLARLVQLLPALDLQPVSAAWLALEPLLTGKPTAAVLAQADAAAQALVKCSDALARRIERTGAGKPLGLVNLCGRLRMLSQRAAKAALLADLLPAFEAADLTATLDAFSAGLAELEAAPLSSPAIRELLAQVHEEWLHLLRSLRGTPGAEAASGLARSSEVLLSHLDQLTLQYQQSLQLILG